MDILQERQDTLYIATSKYYLALSIFKIGLSANCYGRVSSLNTSNPSFEDAIADIYFMYKFKVSTEYFSLKHIESVIHQKFNKYRYVRPDRTSEWFSFNDITIETVITYIEYWCKKQDCLISLEGPFTFETSYNEYVKINKDNKDTTNELSKAFQLVSENHIPSTILRNKKLEKYQLELINDVIKYYQNPLNISGYYISPCGSGKTIMTIKILQFFNHFNKIIICVPRVSIAEQWIETLNKLNISGYKIFFCSSKSISKKIGNYNNSTDIDDITKWLINDKIIIISSYASSIKLRKAIVKSKCDICFAILDEAHHMVGTVYNDTDTDTDSDSDNKDNSIEDIDLEETDEEKDKISNIGKSRALLNLFNIKQKLFITATPRVIKNKTINGFYSMDDESIFGKKIHEIKLRELINEGIMPDYKIIISHSIEYSQDYINDKAKVIIKHMMQKNPYYTNNTNPDNNDTAINNKHYILNKLIIFMETNESGKKIKQYLDTINDVDVIYIDGNMTVHEYNDSILKFKDSSRRSIIINCKMLNEGVDITIADSVAICYGKHSRVEIIQMLLRAGRWTPDKSFFYILLPLSNGEGYEGIEDVLASLAINDDALMEEITLKSNSDSDETKTSGGCGNGNSGSSGSGSSKTNTASGDSIIEEDKINRIYIDTVNSLDVEKLRETFKNIRDLKQATIKTTTIKQKTFEEICKIIRANNITTRDHYNSKYIEINLPNIIDLQRYGRKIYGNDGAFDIPENGFVDESQLMDYPRQKWITLKTFPQFYEPWFNVNNITKII